MRAHDALPVLAHRRDGRRVTADRRDGGRQGPRQLRQDFRGARLPVDHGAVGVPGSRGHVVRVAAEDRDDPGVLQHLARGLGPARVVVEHECAARLRSGRRGGRGCDDGDERERAAGARRARDVDVSAHQRNDAVRDGESQAGAAEFPRDRGVGLLEGLEQLGARRLRHPDARVAHGEPDVQRVVRHVHRFGREFDLARRRELHGVRQQVQQHLAQPLRIAAHDGRQHGVRAPEEGQPLRAGAERDRAHRLEHQVAQIERRVVQLELARLELAEVEDVVDDRLERRAAVPRRLEVVARLGVERVAEREFGVAHEAVDRRPDLVAHVREEFALRTDRGQRGVACLGHGGVGTLEILLVRLQCRRQV